MLVSESLHFSDAFPSLHSPPHDQTNTIPSQAHLHPRSSSLLNPQRPRFTLVLAPTHRELKPHASARQLPVNLRIGIQPEVHATPLLLIKHHLQNLAPILLRAHPLPHNLDWVHHVRQDRIVHGGQGAGPGPFLGLGGAAAVGAFGAREDAARGQDEHVPVRELLLQFACQALLDLVEAGEEGDGDEDHDRALAVANFELWLGMCISFCQLLVLRLCENCGMVCSEPAGWIELVNSNIPLEQRRIEEVVVRI